RRRVAYMRLDTFSPDTLVITPDGQFLDINPVEQVKEMLDLMVHEGIHDLVIDMVDNGGGSLVLGLEVAQALSAENIMMPAIRSKLSEEWLDAFPSPTIFGSSPEERERAEAVFNQLLGEFEDQPFGLSTDFPIESLAPHAFQPNLK